MSVDKYFDEKESSDTLYLVFDLIKQLFNEGKISKKLIYEILTLISNCYIDNFNAREFECFLHNPANSNKGQILFSSNNRFLIKFLTFFFLIHIYICGPQKIIVERLLEKEIIKILIHIYQNKSEEKEILDFFRILTASLSRLNTKKFFINRILSEKEMNPEMNSQKYLLADFFFDYLVMKKRPNLSISELYNRLTELETKTVISSDKSSKINYSERAKSINQGNLFFLKDQIVKLLKTQGKTSEEIDNILKDMNDNQEKLIAFLYRLKVKK